MQPTNPNNRNKPRQNNQRRPNGQAPNNPSMSARNASRGQAVRAQKRSQMDAQKFVNQYASAATNGANPQQRRANVITDDFDKLKITFLGGQEAIGEKNMQVIEWQNDAVILDCGNDLSVDLPGINYTINDPAYLETIKHKIRGYVVSH